MGGAPVVVAHGAQGDIIILFCDRPLEAVKKLLLDPGDPGGRRQRAA